MINSRYHKTFIILLFISIVFGVVPFVNAEENIATKLIVEDVTFTSSLKYLLSDISDFVENYPGELIIRIKNIGGSSSPKAELYAELRYTYPRTRNSPVIGAAPYDEDRLQLGRLELDAINPNKTSTAKIKIPSILLKGPAINNSVTLKFLMRDLSKDRNVFYEADYHTYRISSESEIKKEKRNDLYLFAGIILAVLPLSFPISRWIKKKLRERQEKIRAEDKKALDEKEKLLLIIDDDDLSNVTIQDKKDV